VDRDWTLNFRVNRFLRLLQRRCRVVHIRLQIGHIALQFHHARLLLARLRLRCIRLGGGVGSRGLRLVDGLILVMQFIAQLLDLLLLRRQCSLLGSDCILQRLHIRRSQSRLSLGLPGFWRRAGLRRHARRQKQNRAPLPCRIHHTLLFGYR
jgi:hypothetical protein